MSLEQMPLDQISSERRPFEQRMPAKNVRTFATETKVIGRCCVKISDNRIIGIRVSGLQELEL